MEEGKGKKWGRNGWDVRFFPEQTWQSYSHQINSTDLNYGDHNFIEITQQTSCESRLSLSSCRAGRANRARRVERVEPCCSTSSTQQPKCMSSTHRI